MGRKVCSVYGVNEWKMMEEKLNKVIGEEREEPT